MVDMFSEPPAEESQEDSGEEKSTEEKHGVELEDCTGECRAGRHGTARCNRSDRGKTIQRQSTVRICEIPVRKCLCHA